MNLKYAMIIDTTHYPRSPAWLLLGMLDEGGVEYGWILLNPSKEERKLLEDCLRLRRWLGKNKPARILGTEDIRTIERIMTDNLLGDTNSPSDKDNALHRALAAL